MEKLSIYPNVLRLANTIEDMEDVYDTHEQATAISLFLKEFNENPRENDYWDVILHVLRHLKKSFKEACRNSDVQSELKKLLKNEEIEVGEVVIKPKAKKLLITQ